MDELLAEFITETKESLDALDVDIVKLEQDPNDKNLLSSIFRVMHTIKGTCGFLGLDLLASLAHSAENVLGSIRDDKTSPTPEVISVILIAIDRIKDIVATVEETGAEGSFDNKEIITKLDNLLGGEQDSEISNDDMLENDESKQEVNNNINSNQELVESSDIAATIPEKKLAISEEVKKEAIIHGINLDQQLSEVKASNQSVKAPVQTIRVNIDLLENLMQLVSELVLNRNQLMQILRSINNIDNPFSIPLQRLNNITFELQDCAMKTRMHPIGNAWTQLPRIIRDLSVDLGKKIELKMIGEETELDKQLIEAIKDPLTHMVRNSADHGIEMPDERIAKGKQASGTITLHARHQGSFIVIEISDDGKGLNIDRIKNNIIEKGLAGEEELMQMTDQQIYSFIFKPGFSTAEKVTAVSGRGVGMDVVRSNIEKVGGNVELNSTQGKGTTFLIKIPLTLAIIPILIIECNNSKFGIPQINIIELIKAGEKYEHKIEIINGNNILKLRDNLIPLISLRNMLYPEGSLGVQENEIANAQDVQIVLCEIGGFDFGIIVDKIYDTEEIVVKPVPPVLKKLEIYSGSTLLGDGNVIMILDLNGLTRMINIDNMTSKTARNRNILSVNTAKFLIFMVTGKKFAIPLDIVTRLEEIDSSKIEQSLGHDVIQYNNSLMHIVKLDPEYVFSTDSLQQIIVFANQSNILGVAIEEIIDIIEHPVESTILNGQKEGFMGAILLEEQTMDLIDIKYYYHQMFGSLEPVHEISHDVQIANMPVLFIDDSPFFRKFIPPTMEKSGFKVTTAADVKTAIEILHSSTQFSIIVTDINMPGASGYDLAKYCKRQEKFAQIPIIALSANFQNGNTDSSDEFDAFVAKTNYGELINIMRRLTSEESLKYAVG
jgi:two-component system, chemotaxis family, sensor kinase CheA